MRLARELELDAATRSRLFYALLLKDAGCSANSAKMAALFGADDHVDQAVVQARSTGRGACRRSHGRSGRSRRGARCGTRLDRLLAIKARGRVHTRRDAGPLRSWRGDRPHAGTGGRDRRGDPRARRALGRRRPAASASRRGDPAAREDPLPRPDGGDLLRRGRDARGVGGGPQAARALVRSRARRGAGSDPRRHGVLGLAARGRRSLLGARGSAAHGRQRRAWTGSPTPSPASSTRSRPGPIATPIAPA